MTDDDEVQHDADLVQLVVDPPKVPLTRWQRFWRGYQYVAGTLGVIALVVACWAGVRAVSTASCINANNGARAVPSNNDRAAQERWIGQIAGLFTGEVTGPQLKADTLAYQKILSTDDTIRAANPTGKC